MADVFINNAFNDAMKLYIDYIEKPENVLFNGFLATVVRMLVLIYGEEIVNYYKEGNEESFDQLLTRYGYDDVKGFKSVFDKTYKAMKRQSDKAIKKKNKHFNVVQKDLIDMLVKRNESEQLDKDVIRDFSNLLFTANNPDFYRKSVALLEAYDPYEIDEYFKKFNLI